MKPTTAKQIVWAILSLAFWFCFIASTWMQLLNHPQAAAGATIGWLAFALIVTSFNVHREEDLE